jgi:hypothetical protein
MVEAEAAPFGRHVAGEEARRLALGDELGAERRVGTMGRAARSRSIGTISPR